MSELQPYEMQPAGDALREARRLLDTITLAYAQWCRETAKDVLDGMQVMVESVADVLPDRATAAALSFPYSAQAALTELNGARVRIMDVVDDLETIPDGTDPAVNFAPIPTINKLRAALIAGVDLQIKVDTYEQQAPSVWQQTQAEIKQGAGDVGDLLGGALGNALKNIATNLWWVLGIAAVIFFFVYIKGPKGLAVAA